MAEQPMPIPSDRRPIVDMVREDLAERMRVGIKRYGTPLQAHNGRDALRDAYEEALDLACYLRQAIEERDNPRPDPVETRVRALMEGRTLDEVLTMPWVVGQAITEELYCVRMVRRRDSAGAVVVCGQSLSAHVGNALGHPMSYGRPVITVPETGWYQVMGTGEMRQWMEQAKARLPQGLCGDREDHEPHRVSEGSLAPFWCTADQTQREPARSQRLQDARKAALKAMDPSESVPNENPSEP